MHVSLENIGKRFDREWIFRGVNHVFSTGKATAILGANGSGKSTLLQIIAGSMMQLEGKAEYSLGEKKIQQEEVYRYVSIASPYLELMEDLTLQESISLQGKFKSWRNALKEKDILEISELGNEKNKQLKNFSSGMKMRTKLVLAVLSDAPLLLLDEPCSNLDKNSCEWYGKLVRENSAGRTIIVCSNQVKDEYFFCSDELRMENFKK
ncbi:MAG: ATP-binding cassette domain-containing protein [Bacteroidetes bacterium]|nr:ATP-binding cassette domain-containing protein [Bacteroidota bacterium]